MKTPFLPFLTLAGILGAQPVRPALSAPEQPISDQIRGLRKLADDARAGATRRLALEIRALPASPNKLRLASTLANLSTEGDFGRDTLQEVATTLAAALEAESGPGADSAWSTLAQFVRYEGMKAPRNDPQLTAALAKLERADEVRNEADFTLRDLQGNAWRLRGLRGKVVLVNFWATWCPPCRKEMPDLEALSREFKEKGLVVLAISDEEETKVKTFVQEARYTFPVLLDQGRKVSELFQVEGIPKTFIYNREGRLAAQSVDMRTRGQFLALLAQAGVE